LSELPLLFLLLLVDPSFQFFSQELFPEPEMPPPEFTEFPCAYSIVSVPVPAAINANETAIKRFNHVFFITFSVLSSIFKSAFYVNFFVIRTT